MSPRVLSTVFSGRMAPARPRCSAYSPASSSATVVLATHQMETADALCDTVSIIDRGSLVANDTPRALKRRLGKRSLLVETGANGAIRGDRIPFDDESSAVRIAAALRDRTLVSIHSEEATLDDVFRQLTGKSLKEALS